MPLPSNPPSPTRSPGERRFVRHIGLHHFAYLRAVAEGLDIAQCAARYLGTEHGHEARSAHQQTVDAGARSHAGVASPGGLRAYRSGPRALRSRP
jgi:hypothetical protein